MHAARLRNGQDVVIKVQYPEAQRHFRDDIRTITGFCRVFALEEVQLMGEIEKQFVTEFDYTLEAQLLRQAAANIMPNFARVAIPLPIDCEHPKAPLALDGTRRTLCTTRCLVMERLHGTSLQRAQRAQLAQLAARRNVTVGELQRDLEAAYHKGELHQLLPSSTTLRLYGAWLLISDATQTAAARVRSWWAGAPPPPPVRTPPPLDAPRLIGNRHGAQTCETRPTAHDLNPWV